MAKASRPAFRAEIEVFGVDQTAGRLKAIGARARDTFPLMERIKQVLFEQQAERARSMPWAPLQQVTIDRKIATQEDPTIFHDEWRPIKGSATRVGNKLWFALTMDGATGQIKRATRTTAQFGLDARGNRPLFYARFVQNTKGTQRRLLGISTANAEEILLTTAEYIYSGWDHILA